MTLCTLTLCPASVVCLQILNISAPLVVLDSTAAAAAGASSSAAPPDLSGIQLCLLDTPGPNEAGEEGLKYQVLPGGGGILGRGLLCYWFQCGSFLVLFRVWSALPDLSGISCVCWTHQDPMGLPARLLGRFDVDTPPTTTTTHPPLS